MTDSFATAAGPADGEQAMSRLADRIVAMAPPRTVLELDNPTPPPVRPSPAMATALERTTAMTEVAEQCATAAAAAALPAKAVRHRRSLIAATIDGFVTSCFIPYALVALVLRLLMAGVFFLDGQTRVDGPHYVFSLQGFDVSLVLPLQVKAETFVAFLGHSAALPLPPALAAYLVSGAEFVLPIMLVLGFGTRIAALGLMLVTALIQLYVLPGALWTTHVYWVALLLVLLSHGPGPVSLDKVIRLLARR